MYRDGERFKYDAMSVVRTKSVFNLPLKIKEPSRIFTSSLTDFFHPAIDPYRHEAWDIIRQCSQHTFQILTKRPERIIQCLPPDWGAGWDNVWLGTSIGSQESIHRLSDLILPVRPGIQFLSLEPLHGPIDLRLGDRLDHGHWVCDLVNWVIIGGESGNEVGKYRYRPCKLEWIESIVEQCQDHKVPVFVKQLGTHLAKKMGLKDRHGGDMVEWPEHLRTREFPIRKP